MVAGIIFAIDDMTCAVIYAVPNDTRNVAGAHLHLH
jgi:hypothetical protein